MILRVGVKVVGPKWGRHTLPKMDAPPKVDGPVESGRSSVEKWTVSGQSEQSFDGCF